VNSTESDVTEEEEEAFEADVIATEAVTITAITLNQT
jgi:hypothetical protein